MGISNPNVGSARKVVLPEVIFSEASEEPLVGATKVSLPTEDGGQYHYYSMPVSGPTKSRRDGKPAWVQGVASRFPVVLCGDGSPWIEANLWLIDRFEATPTPNMETLAILADDLAAFRRFLEDENVDWLDFSASQKFRRPTYRYNGYLVIRIQSGEVSASLAKRRMAAIIRFYRWIVGECGVQLQNSPWIEGDHYVQWKDSFGRPGTIVVKTTDISISRPVADNLWDDCLVDDGQLRPLPQPEQLALLESLAQAGNTEMSLIHLTALLTGARIQSVLTIRLRHVLRPSAAFSGHFIQLLAGPGTGIDTKRGKEGIIFMPKAFYERLHIYAVSERAKRRRLKAKGGDIPDQFLFLSRNGKCFYEPKGPDTGIGGRGKRHITAGQGVRQFIKEKLLPDMRRRLDSANYRFSFHDLRATFGVNWVDGMAPLMEAGKLTYSQALDRLRQIMWHSSTTVTEHYLKYRTNRAMVTAAEEGWHHRLEELATAFSGLESKADDEDH